MQNLFKYKMRRMVKGSENRARGRNRGNGNCTAGILKIMKLKTESVNDGVEMFLLTMGKNHVMTISLNNVSFIEKVSKIINAGFERGHAALIILHPIVEFSHRKILQS